VGEGHLGEELAGCVVVDLVVFDYAAMAVVGVFAEANVGDNKEVRRSLFDFLYGALDNSGFGPGL
jgi:hypothetical protein